VSYIDTRDSTLGRQVAKLYLLDTLEVKDKTFAYKELNILKIDRKLFSNLLNKIKAVLEVKLQLQGKFNTLVDYRGVVYNLTPLISKLKYNRTLRTMKELEDSGYAYTSLPKNIIELRVKF